MSALRVKSGGFTLFLSYFMGHFALFRKFYRKSFGDIQNFYYFCQRVGYGATQRCDSRT